jgi:hypothetical protein
MALREDHKVFLDSLQEWGVKDMSGAAPYLQQQFPELDMIAARKVLAEWSATKHQLLNEDNFECKNF